MGILRSCPCWYVICLISTYSFSNIRKPKARISIFRAEVKDRCVAAVMLAIDTDNSPAAIAGIVDDLLKDFNYIYPRQSKVSAARPQFSGKHTETMLTI